MSYTPTEWHDGDTITAEAMNNIEQGIVDAGGVASVRISATGFASASRTFGYIITAYRDNNSWIVSNDFDETWIVLFGFTSPNYRVVNVIIPSDTDVAVFLVDSMNADTARLSLLRSNAYVDMRSAKSRKNNLFRTI